MGGSQFSSTVLWSSLVIVSDLAAEGTVGMGGKVWKDSAWMYACVRVYNYVCVCVCVCVHVCVCVCLLVHVYTITCRVHNARTGMHNIIHHIACAVYNTICD